MPMRISGLQQQKKLRKYSSAHLKADKTKPRELCGALFNQTMKTLFYDYEFIRGFHFTVNDELIKVYAVI